MRHCNRRLDPLAHSCSSDSECARPRGGAIKWRGQHGGGGSLGGAAQCWPARRCASAACAVAVRHSSVQSARMLYDSPLEPRLHLACSARCSGEEKRRGQTSVGRPWSVLDHPRVKLNNNSNNIDSHDVWKKQKGLAGSA